MRIKTLSTLALLLPALSSSARAGGFSTARFGSEHGHAATEHPSAIYFNPAGLALGSGTRLHIEGLFAFRTAAYERPEGAIDNVLTEGEAGAGTPADATAVNAGKAELGNFVASPFIAVVSDLGVENLGVAAGVYVPFGGSSAWDQNPAFEGNTRFPGAVDGVQRWANIEGQQTALYGTLAGAYRFEAARLSVGAGMSVVRQTVKTVRARTIVGTDDVVTDTGAIVEGRSLLDVSNTTVGLSGGVIWQPVERVWLGLAYQSRPGFGERGLHGTLENRFGISPPSESEVELTQELPDIIRFAVRARINERTELRMGAEFQRWSAFDRQCLMARNDPNRDCTLEPTGAAAPQASGVILNIPRDWEDTWGARVGASYWVAPAVELNVGTGYDSNAVPDDTLDPGLMDMDKIISNLGVVWTTPLVGLGAQLSYSNVYYFGRDVDPRPRDANGNPEAPAPPSRNPDMAGEYEQAVHLLILGLTYRL